MWWGDTMSDHVIHANKLCRCVWCETERKVIEGGKRRRKAKRMSDDLKNRMDPDVAWLLNMNVDQMEVVRAVVEAACRWEDFAVIPAIMLTPEEKEAAKLRDAVQRLKMLLHPLSRNWK